MQFQLSKKQWKSIGKQTGWIKSAGYSSDPLKGQEMFRKERNQSPMGDAVREHLDITQKVHDQQHKEILKLRLEEWKEILKQNNDPETRSTIFSTIQYLEKRIREYEKKSQKVSNCCGVPDKMTCQDGPDFSDIGVCPNCKQHCVFEEQQERDLEDPS